jgi:hypothetical protein
MCTSQRVVLHIPERHLRGMSEVKAGIQLSHRQDGLRVQDEYEQNSLEDRPLPRIHPAIVEYVEN